MHITVPERKRETLHLVHVLLGPAKFKFRILIMSAIKELTI